MVKTRSSKALRMIGERAVTGDSGSNSVQTVEVVEGEILGRVTPSESNVVVPNMNTDLMTDLKAILAEFQTEFRDEFRKTHEKIDGYRELLSTSIDEAKNELRKDTATQIQTAIETLEGRIQAVKARAIDINAGEVPITAQAITRLETHVAELRIAAENHLPILTRIVKDKPPTFSNNDTVFPLEFLNELENWFRKWGLKPETWITELKTNTNIFQGSAKFWFGATKSTLNNYFQFRDEFLRAHWNEPTRLRKRGEWANRRYDSRSPLSLTEYFYDQLHRATQIDEKMTKFEIIYHIIRQFPPQCVYSLIGTVDCNDMNSVLERLSVMENPMLLDHPEHGMPQWNYQNKQYPDREYKLDKSNETNRDRHEYVPTYNRFIPPPNQNHYSLNTNLSKNNETYIPPPKRNQSNSNSNQPLNPSRT